jgi:hypothetical protein
MDNELRSTGVCFFLPIVFFSFYSLLWFPSFGFSFC